MVDRDSWETASQQGVNCCIQPPGLEIPLASRLKMSLMRCPKVLAQPCLHVFAASRNVLGQADFG